MWAPNTCGERDEIELTIRVLPDYITAPVQVPGRPRGPKVREPFTSTPVGVNSISSGSPHVRPMGVHRTCGA